MNAMKIIKPAKIAKMLITGILVLALLFPGVSVTAFGSDMTASESSAAFDTNTKYYIWLKKDSSTSDDPLSVLRQTEFRWNINGGGGGKNAEVHLDYSSGDNCEMVFKSVGSGYYGIRYEDSSYWIDTEKDDGKTGRVLHQNSKDLEKDKYNQHFEFIPVSGEEDTYYIRCRKGNVYVGTENNAVSKHAKIVTTDQAHAKKWIVKAINDPLLTGKEEVLYGSKEAAANRYLEDPMFTLNPKGYKCDVNVHNDGIAIGNCLQLYYIGTSSKITAEWVENEQAYRLRSHELNEDGLYYSVWDIDGQSHSAGAVAHVWENDGDEHTSQLWRFIPVEGENGVYYIYNVNSSLYLSIEGGYDKSKNDKNDVKLVQSATAFPWELHMINERDVHAYTENTSSAINAGNWMSKLPDSMYLSELNMPGTHDAGAANMFLQVDEQVSSTLCQQLYLDEQLNAGIRAWDIRIDRASAKTESDPNIVHGLSAAFCRNSTGQVLELDEVMWTARNFLKTHPLETVIITLKGDGKTVGSDEDVANHVLKYIKDSSFPIYRPAVGEGGKVPTLGQVRGKIVFVRRLALSNSYIQGLNQQSPSLIDAFGPDASKWDDNTYTSHKRALQVGSSCVYAQDNYGEGDASRKLEYFYGTIDDATGNKLTANGNAYLFNYSAAKDNLSQPRSIDSNLMDDARLAQPASQMDKKTIGIVMANYIDAKLAARIYMTNFVTDHTHKYSSSGICDACGGYQPAVLNSKGTYEISNAGQLFWFAALVNGDGRQDKIDKKEQTAEAVLTKDIDLGGREWTPIKDFNGSFDGQKHTISNLSITRTSSYSGLFGSSAGTIKNFTLKGEIALSSGGTHIGGVVGSADGAKLSRVFSYVKISNTGGPLVHVGGVIGSIGNAQTTVELCDYYGTIEVNDSHDCIGGIAGYTSGGGRISSCANHGTVTGTKKGAYVGGILGYVNNSAPIIKNCYNYGKVSNGGDGCCGAIIGWARNYNTAETKNNYYLDSSASLALGSGSKEAAVAEVKTAGAFASGEVAYLLNGGTTEGDQNWYQNLDNGQTPDQYPKFEGGTVYCSSEDTNTYTNTNPNLHASVRHVIKLVNKIPSPVTLKSESAIAAARQAYEKLLAEQKGSVTNYQKLLDAEKALAKLKKASNTGNENQQTAAADASADAAKTGDSSMIYMWCLLLIASGAAVVLLLASREKKKNR